MRKQYVVTIDHNDPDNPGEGDYQDADDLAHVFNYYFPDTRTHELVEVSIVGEPGATYTVNGERTERVTGCFSGNGTITVGVFYECSDCCDTVYSTD